MLKLNNLTIEYKDKTVIDHMNIEFKQNTVTAIVGESGTGKTSLALSVLGLNEGKISGEILVDGKNILEYSKKELKGYRWTKVAMVFQNIEGTMNPAEKIIVQVAEPMIEHKFLNKKEAFKRAEFLLKEVCLNERCFNKYPTQLSGGQLQRAQIAVALSNDPDILILDEPTSALDPITKKDITDMLNRISKDRCVLLITHDFSVARDLSDRTMVLYRGKILESGDTEDVLTRPAHPYTRGLLRSYPNMSTTKDLQGIKGEIEWHSTGCPFYNRCTQRLDICKEKIPDLNNVNGRYIACHRGGLVNVIEAVKLYKSYGDVKALNGVSVNLSEGETLAIVGESGSGKSTFAKCMIGLEKFDLGKIIFGGEILKKIKTNKEYYRNVQMIFQNPKSSINMKMSIFDVLQEPMAIQKIGSLEERKWRAKELLTSVQLPSDDDFLEESPEKLSGGELQRIAIARALMLKPKILIADEPTSALDVSVQAKIMKLLMDLQDKLGVSIIFITHDIALARKVSDKIVVLKDGNIVESGMTPQVISMPISSYTKQLICAASKIF